MIKTKTTTIQILRPSTNKILWTVCVATSSACSCWLKVSFLEWLCEFISFHICLVKVGEQKWRSAYAAMSCAYETWASENWRQAIICRLLCEDVVRMPYDRWRVRFFFGQRKPFRFSPSHSSCKREQRKKGVNMNQARKLRYISNKVNLIIIALSISPFSIASSVLN